MAKLLKKVSSDFSFRVYLRRFWWIRVFGYGELFYNSTFLRQAVAGCGTCLLQIICFFKPPSLPLLMMSICSYRQIHPRDTIGKPTLSKQHFRSGEHNPRDDTTRQDKTRQAVSGCGTCSLQIICFFKPPPLALLMKSIAKYTQLWPSTPEGHYRKTFT